MREYRGVVGGGGGGAGRGQRVAVKISQNRSKSAERRAGGAHSVVPTVAMSISGKSSADCSSAMFLVNSKIFSVTFSGAGPPFSQLNLMPAARCASARRVKNGPNPSDGEDTGRRCCLEPRGVSD